MRQGGPTLRTHLGFARRSERLARGHLRITTHERYPKDAYVDVFVMANAAGLVEPTLLTDFGNTMAWQLDTGLGSQTPGPTTRSSKKSSFASASCVQAASLGSR